MTGGNVRGSYDGPGYGAYGGLPAGLIPQTRGLSIEANRAGTRIPRPQD